MEEALPSIGLFRGPVEWGMVAGPEAELALQRGGVLRHGTFFQLVSFSLSYLLMGLQNGDTC